MSTRRRDPKDVAIEFVLTQPLEAAAMFVQTLASIVKARGNGVAMQATPAAPRTRKPTTAAAPAAASGAEAPPAKPRSRGALREVLIVDPNAKPTDPVATASSGEEPAQPSILEGAAATT